MKIVSVVGARPQFIKSFPVSRELRKANKEILVHTGQHYDEEMSNVFFEELGIPDPEYNLGVGSGPHGRQTAEMITGLESVVTEVDPEIILCYGDTNSTLAAAIVGSKYDGKLVHVEAGLRSHNREMPEEINRVLTDHSSDLLFAPCQSAVENLASEGITHGVFDTGDVMYDALLWAKEEAEARSSILERVGLTKSDFVLATVHRPRNTDDRKRIEIILDCLADDPRSVVFPAHPRTIDRLEECGLLEFASRELTLIDPVGYLDFVQLLSAADVVATDSGGVQKEAFFIETPCVTLREETEWIETVEIDANILVGADPSEISSALRSHAFPAETNSPYGSGRAAKNICEILTST